MGLRYAAWISLISLIALAARLGSAQFGETAVIVWLPLFSLFTVLSVRSALNRSWRGIAEAWAWTVLAAPSWFLFLFAWTVVDGTVRYYTG